MTSDEQTTTISWLTLFWHTLNDNNDRTIKDTTSIQRGIIRHVYLVIDLSLAMLVKEFKATWLDLTLTFAQVCFFYSLLFIRYSLLIIHYSSLITHDSFYSIFIAHYSKSSLFKTTHCSKRSTMEWQEFVSEFFDQNPISQMAILCTKSGAAERLSPLSGTVSFGPSQTFYFLKLNTQTHNVITNRKSNGTPESVTK